MGVSLHGNSSLNKAASVSVFAMDCVLFSADEHAQTSESPDMAAATPPARRGPDAAEAARQVARAGRAAIRRQHPSSLRARHGNVCPGAASSHSGRLRGHRAPNQQTERILIPSDGTAGDQGLRIGLPARRRRLRDACGLSRLNDFPALRPQAHMPSRNRQVTSTATRMAKPGPASVPTVTHRYKRAHCLWFEQFQIDAPMFVKAFFLHCGYRRDPGFAECGHDGDGRSRWRAGSYQVTRSAGQRGPGAAGGSLGGQRVGAAAR
jgi:hypothetical protein